MKKLILAISMFIIPAFMQAQTPPEPIKELVAAGASLNPQGSTQILGMLLYAKQVSAGLYSFSLIDVTPVYDPNAKFHISTLTTNTTTGLAQYLRSVGPARIYALATAGIGSSSNAAGLAYSAGGAAVIPLGSKGWVLMPNVRMLKNTQSNFLGVYGLAVGYGK